MSRRGRRIAAVAAGRAAAVVWRTRFGLRSGRRGRAIVGRELRLACEALGPTFVKLGQLASVRPDVVPPEIVAELERLQDHLPPVPVDEIAAVLARELGAAPERVFATFEPAPVATASIAQVHAATLAADYRPVVGAPLAAGTRLAVKVVRPGIERVIAEDMPLARRWARRAERVPRLARLRPTSTLEQLASSVASELDLRNEGRSADRFARDFADDPRVLVPRVVWRHSTRRVLVTEFVRGWRLTELDEAARAGIDARGLAEHGASAFLRQVLVHGRFHADLHPANLLVTPDGRICYLDFGIFGRADAARREAFAELLAATAYGDAERALRASRRLGLEVPDGAVPRLRSGVDDLMRAHLDREPADVRGFALGFLALLADARIAIPEGYGLLIKALLTIEGVARAIYPDIDVVASAKPFVTRLVAARAARPERLRDTAPAALRAALRELFA